MNEPWTKLFDYTCFSPSSPNDRTELGERRAPSCRFCGGCEPAVRFRKAAHLIPAAFGNRTLFSNQECDDCNERAGKTIEADLVNALSLARVITGTRSRTGSSTLKIRTDLLAASYITGRTGESLIVEAEGDDSVHVEVDEENHSIKLRATIPKYRPAWVAKSLARMLYFVVDDADALQLEHVRKWVLGQVKWEPLAYLSIFMPGPQNPEFRLTAWRGTDIPFAVQFGNGSFSFLLLVPDASWTLRPDRIQLPPLGSTVDMLPGVHVVAAPSQDTPARHCKWHDISPIAVQRRAARTHGDQGGSGGVGSSDAAPE